MPAKVETGCDAASLRVALRRATHDLHRELQGRLPLLAADLTQPRYTAIVAAFYGLYRPLETALTPQASCLPALQWERRRKVKALQHDLRMLGLSDAAIAALPASDHLPAIADVPAMLGCLYVVEGATLGGQIIRARLQTTLGVTETTGAAFFAGYGATTEPMWQAYLRCLDRMADGERVQASAQATFAAFLAWFGARGVLR